MSLARRRCSSPNLLAALLSAGHDDVPPRLRQRLLLRPHRARELVLARVDPLPRPSNPREKSPVDLHAPPAPHVRAHAYPVPHERRRLRLERPRVPPVVVHEHDVRHVEVVQRPDVVARRRFGSAERAGVANSEVAIVRDVRDLSHLRWHDERSLVHEHEARAQAELNAPVLDRGEERAVWFYSLAALGLLRLGRRRRVQRERRRRRLLLRPVRDRRPRGRRDDHALFRADQLVRPERVAELERGRGDDGRERATKHVGEIQRVSQPGPNRRRRGEPSRRRDLPVVGPALEELHRVEADPKRGDAVALSERDEDAHHRDRGRGRVRPAARASSFIGQLKGDAIKC
eukprot:31077-Pelagococcus_subviridis.AAC.2